MRKRFRTRQADLLVLVSCTQLKFACQAALLPSVLLAAVHLFALSLLSFIKLFKHLMMLIIMCLCNFKLMTTNNSESRF